MYRIVGVTVDATAESGVAARDQAIAAGQREGLTRLMQRLTSPTAHRHLPDVAAVPIERYVNSFEIAQEKVGPTRYMGTLNVNYVAAEVQSLLSSAGIPHVQRRSDPILVVPVELSDGAPAAWDETSPWRAAWYEGIEQATVTVLALPLGDLADIAAAPPGVAHGRRSAGAGRAGQPLRDGDDRGRGGAHRSGTRHRQARAASTLPSAAPAPGAPAPGDDRWRSGPEEDEPAALSRAIGQVVAAIEDDWKRRTAGRIEPVTTARRGGAACRPGGLGADKAGTDGPAGSALAGSGIRSRRRRLA